MTNELQEQFPFSREELLKTIATVDAYISYIVNKAPMMYAGTIKKNYSTALYPLYAIWEGYGYGELNEIGFDYSLSFYYEAFKTIPEETLVEFSRGMQRENPFAPPYGPFEDSNILVDQLLVMYQNLLKNLWNGSVVLPIDDSQY